MMGSKASDGIVRVDNVDRELNGYGELEVIGGDVRLSVTLWKMFGVWTLT